MHVSFPRSSSPEDLKRFGYEAASKFLNKEASLNESIAEHVRDNDLNPDQTARVVEVANNTVFKELFEKSASKIVEFPLADPAKIREMVASNTPRTKTAGVLPEPRSSIRGAEGVELLRELFPDIEKTAAADPHENPQANLKRMYMDLTQERERQKIAQDTAHAKLTQAGGELIHHVKQALLSDEADLEDVLLALEGLHRGEGLVKSAMNLMLINFARQHVPLEKYQGKKKTASLTPNPDHPISKAFTDYCDHSIEYRARKGVVKNLDHELDRIKHAMQEIWK